MLLLHSALLYLISSSRPINSRSSFSVSLQKSPNDLLCGFVSIKQHGLIRLRLRLVRPCLSHTLPKVPMSHIVPLTRRLSFSTAAISCLLYSLTITINQRKMPLYTLQTARQRFLKKNILGLSAQLAELLAELFIVSWSKCCLSVSVVCVYVCLCVCVSGW